VIRPIAHFRASQNPLARERLVLSVWMERAAALRNRVKGAVVIGGHERLAGRRKRGGATACRIRDLPTQSPSALTALRRRFGSASTLDVRRPQRSRCRLSARAPERRSAMETIVRTAAAGRSRLGECTSGEPGAGCPVGAAARTRKQWRPESHDPLATASRRAIQLAREAACRARRTSKRPSSTDRSRHHCAKAGAHGPTARRRRPRRSVSAPTQSGAAPSEGGSTPAGVYLRPDRAQRRTNSPTKCESSPNTSNATTSSRTSWSPP
jgi:hypothetical protein